MAEDNELIGIAESTLNKIRLMDNKIVKELLESLSLDDFEQE